MAAAGIGGGGGISVGCRLGLAAPASAVADERGGAIAGVAASGRNWSGRNWSGRNWNGRNWNGRNWNGRNWSGRNWNGRHWNGRNWCNNVVFIGDFGFPYWWGWGWGGYPYGYYGYGYPYDYYGSGYDGYGYGGTEMMVTDMITVSMAIAADPGSLNCSGDSGALAIIVALSTGFWGPRRGERFEITSASMEMLADR